MAQRQDDQAKKLIMDKEAGEEYTKRAGSRDVTPSKELEKVFKEAKE